VAFDNGLTVHGGEAAITLTKVEKIGQTIYFGLALGFETGVKEREESTGGR
jgi:hypothetical protein